jgi:hypothetical protein
VTKRAMKTISVRIALVIGLIGAMASFRLIGESDPSIASPSSISRIQRPGPPPPEPDRSILVGAEAVTLQKAQESFPFKLYLPDDELASDASISAVWWAPISPAVELQYSSGLRVVFYLSSIGNEDPGGAGEEERYDPPADFAELANRLAAQAAEYQGGTPSDYLAQVKGGTAYVVPHRSVVHSAAVMFAYPEDVWITIYGDYEAGLLLRVAESMG